MLSGMKRFARTTTVLIAVAIAVSIVGQRLVGADFSPAAAHEPAPAGVTVSSTDPTAAAPGLALEPVRGSGAVAAAEKAAEPVAAPAPVSVPVTAAEPTAAPAATAVPATPQPVAPQPTVRPAPTAAPAPTAPPVATAAPAGCPATWFCYPRLGIAGAIVPYTDCGGTTDIGTSIRSFTCLSPFYLMGHAYTQFGLITQWRAGDIVFASGRQFTITGAFTQSSCEAPARALAPLSLQTSLTSGGCGSVLVVQGN
jgi:hypothetical protein